MTIISTTAVLRPRDAHDFYPTQPALAKAALTLVVSPLRMNKVLDPGCGTGVWGQAAREAYTCKLRITGVDMYQTPQPGIYDAFHQEDYLTWTPDQQYDLVVGNPPYKFAEEFVRKSLSALRTYGELIFLLRMNFLASRKRTSGLFTEMRPDSVYILSTRPSFTQDGKSDDNEYALFHWTKPPVYTPADETLISWFDWKNNKVL